MCRDETTHLDLANAACLIHTLPDPAPNQGLHTMAKSVRSAPTSGHGSGPALRGRNEMECWACLDIPLSQHKPLHSTTS
jgi:hypothetical protein